MSNFTELEKNALHSIALVTIPITTPWEYFLNFIWITSFTYTIVTIFAMGFSIGFILFHMSEFGFKPGFDDVYNMQFGVTIENRIIYIQLALKLANILFFHYCGIPSVFVEITTCMYIYLVFCIKFNYVRGIQDVFFMCYDERIIPLMMCSYALVLISFLQQPQYIYHFTYDIWIFHNAGMLRMQAPEIAARRARRLCKTLFGMPFPDED